MWLKGVDRAVERIEDGSLQNDFFLQNDLCNHISFSLEKACAVFEKNECTVLNSSRLIVNFTGNPLRNCKIEMVKVVKRWFFPYGRADYLDIT